MVPAPSAAVIGSTSIASAPTPPTPAAAPKARACGRDMRPEGRGRRAVRAILASRGDSITCKGEGGEGCQSG
jgi:hypothetical protein